MMATRYPCPCCGYLIHTQGPGDFEICGICGWEDDLSQLRFAGTAGGANRASLIEAQKRTSLRLAPCQYQMPSATPRGVRSTQTSTRLSRRSRVRITARPMPTT